VNRSNYICFIILVKPFSGPTSSSVEKIGDFANFEGMNRLTIEIEPEQNRQIKTLATFAGMTIKEFILSKTLIPKAACF